LTLAALGGLGTLLTQFHHIEPNAKRMAEIVVGHFKPPPPQVVVEAPKPPPKPTVAPLKTSEAMTDMLRALGGDTWSAHFNAHFKNRETALVLTLTEIFDGQFRFEGERQPTYFVFPRNRADLKKFGQPGKRLLIEGDLERYIDTGPGQSDIVIIVRARISEQKEPDPTVTGTIK
jgi:hypothetical protein